MPASAAAVRPPQRAYVGRGRPRRPRTCLLAGRRASAVVGPGMRARRQWSAQACACIGSGRPGQRARRQWSAQACACIGSGRPGLRARRQWSAKERARRSAGAVCARAPVCCRLPARPRRPALSARGARAGRHCPHGARARWPALPARGARAQAGTARTGRARAGRHSPHGARARWPALCARMQGLPARAPVSLRARARRQGLPARAPVCCRLPARAAACTVCCRRPVGAGAAAAVRHYSRGRCLRSRRFSETFATLVPMKTLECKDILPTAYLSGLETSRSMFVRF